MNKRFKNIIYMINKLNDDDIFGLSAELTFYLIMAFFPFVILLLALISITPLSAEETLFRLLSNLPNQVYDIVIYILTGIERSTVIIAVSGVIALWSVSCAVSTIIKALNRMYKTHEKRNFIIIRCIGFLFAILLAIIIILTFFLLILGNVVGMAISNFFPSFQTIWDLLRLIIVYSVLIVAFAMIYKILPDKKIKFKKVVLGALFTTFIWGGASLIFSFYADNFSQYHIIYGSLAGIVLLISWLYMSSFILMLGGEINSLIYINDKNNS